MDILETPIDFPGGFSNGETTEAVDVNRAWRYDKRKNCYRLVAFDYMLFTAGAPVTVEPKTVRVHHDFDMNDVTPA